MPFFFVEWWIKKYGERFNYDLGKYGEKVIVSPYKGVIFIIKDIEGNG